MKKKIALFMVIVMILVTCSFTISAQEDVEVEGRCYCSQCGAYEMWEWCWPGGTRTESGIPCSEFFCTMTRTYRETAFRCNSCNYTNSNNPGLSWHMHTEEHSSGWSRSECPG